MKQNTESKKTQQNRLITWNRCIYQHTTTCTLPLYGQSTPNFGDRPPQLASQPLPSWGTAEAGTVGGHASVGRRNLEPLRKQTGLSPPHCQDSQHHGLRKCLLQAFANRLAALDQGEVAGPTGKRVGGRGAGPD